MLTFRQLDDLPDAVIEIWAETQQEIIDDLARRIARLGAITDASIYQLEQLRETGAVMADVQKRLAEALNKTEAELLRLFDEAATRTLATDDSIYKAAGLSPVPLSENAVMQQIIWAGMDKTMGEFFNLTGTTAQTITGQFESILDLAHQRIVTGAFDYQSAIRMAVKELSREGLYFIDYPSGHRDHFDVAARRATLTGVSQTAARLQQQRFDEMGAEFVETTAHAGARTFPGEVPENHAWWQGRVFFWNRTGADNNTGYPDFIKSTGYGTGGGLCGWNCRHSFYPYYPGVSEVANTRDQVAAMNNKIVTYDGKTMSLYEATQYQRNIERQIRRWKREDNAMASAAESAPTDAERLALTNASWAAHDKVLEWQARQRDFIDQTGLRRDYFRERGGSQLIA